MRKLNYIIIRYNIVSPNIKGGWNIGATTDYDAYKKSVLSYKRLSQRIELLDRISLQSISDQVGVSFENIKVLVLTSDQLPQEHKIRLENLKTKYKWLYIDYLSERCLLSDYSNWVKNDILQEGKEHGKILYSSFRLDDDDALSCDFLRNANKFLKSEFIGFGISFIEGYSAIFDSNQKKFTEFYDLRVLNLALGLGYINYYTSEKGFVDATNITIYDLGNHSIIDKKVPVIVDGKNKSYLRTIYDGQDTLKTSLLKQLKDKKEVSESIVLKKFPVVSSICNKIVENKSLIRVPGSFIPKIINVNRTKNHRFDLLPGEYTYTYHINDMNFVFYANIKEDNDNLTIMFPGAINREKGIYNFQRYTWSNDIDTSVIIFLDPTITENNNLAIGWFQGNQYTYALPIVEELIERIISANSFLEHHITFFGSSAGGYTCLKLADSFLESRVKVINPQINILKYLKSDVDALINYIFPGKSINELSNIERNRLKIGALNLYGRKNPIIYYQNINDLHHTKYHLNEFILENSNLIENFENKGLKFVYYEDYDKGHSPPDKKTTLKILNKDIYSL